MSQDITCRGFTPGYRTEFFMVSPHERKQAQKAFNRDRILTAAKEVFAEKGLEGASIRGIAKACGYTPGAIYFYFESKEEIYAAMLTDVLERMVQAMRNARDKAGKPEDKVRKAVEAAYGFYKKAPQEFDLSFYLFQGARPRGLTPELNKSLNARLEALAIVIDEAIGELGPSDKAIRREEALATLCHVSGILLMENSGRLKILKSSGAKLVARYLDDLLLRLKR